MKLCRNESGYWNNRNICYYFTIAGQERVNMISILRAEACHLGICGRRNVTWECFKMFEPASYLSIKAHTFGSKLQLDIELKVS